MNFWCTRCAFLIGLRARYAGCRHTEGSWGEDLEFTFNLAAFLGFEYMYSTCITWTAGITNCEVHAPDNLVHLVFSKFLAETTPKCSNPPTSTMVGATRLQILA
jgi:hypothetical protein